MAVIKERSALLDNLKYILIVLVVWGHVLNNSDSGINGITLNYIFSFHMPAFIFISGYLTTIKDKQPFKKSITRLIETLLIYNVLIWLAYFTYPKDVYSALTMQFALWYLLSLIYYRCIVQYAHKILDSNKAVVMAVSIVLALLAGLIPNGRILAIYRTIAFFPFFMAGYYIRKGNGLKTIRKIPKWAALMFIIASFIGWSFIDGSEIETLTCNFGYGYYWEEKILRRLLFFINASMMTAALIAITPDRDCFVTQYGKRSIVIYIWHTFFIIFGLRIIAQYGLPTSYAANIIYTVIIVSILMLMCKCRFFTKILNPFHK